MNVGTRVPISRTNGGSRASLSGRRRTEEELRKEAPMTNCPEQIDQVREEMRQIRSNLDDEVATFVQSTRGLLDWRSYIRHAPWLCLGAAALAGYLIVPSKPKVLSPSPEQLVELAKHSRVTVADTS